jgi:hypothetical protein
VKLILSDIVRSQKRDRLKPRAKGKVLPRYYWWYKLNDRGDKWLTVKPTATAETDAEKKLAIDQLLSANRELAKTVVLWGDKNEEERLQLERYQEALQKAEQQFPNEYERKAFPKKAGVGGKSWKQVEKRINELEDEMTGTSSNVELYQGIIEKNTKLIRDYGGEPEYPDYRSKKYEGAVYG